MNDYVIFIFIGFFCMVVYDLGWKKGFNKGLSEVHKWIDKE